MENNQSKLEHLLIQHRDATSTMLEHQQVVDNMQQEINELELDLIPNLLREIGAEKVVADDGTTVESKETFTANVADRNEKEATKILKRIGAGDAMRVKVDFEFIADEKESLVELLKWSKSNKVACTRKNSIHPGTLKKIAKEALAEGKLQPDELSVLGIWSTTRAKIKLPKVD